MYSYSSNQHCTLDKTVCSEVLLNGLSQNVLNGGHNQLSLLLYFRGYVYKGGEKMLIDSTVTKACIM